MHHSDHAVQCRTCPELLWQMIVVINRGVMLHLTTMMRPPREPFDSLRVIEGDALGGCRALLGTRRKAVPLAVEAVALASYIAPADSFWSSVLPSCKNGGKSK